MAVTRLRPLLALVLRVGASAVLVLALTNVVLLAPPRSGSAASESVSPPGTRGGGPSRVGPGTTISLASSTKPPAMNRAQSSRVGRLPSPRSRVATSGSLRRTTTVQSVPQTSLPPLWVSPTAPPAPTDLVAFENTALGSASTAEKTSATDEPSVSMGPSAAFYTGNFYAAVSSDKGRTFNYIDPSAAFPPSVYGTAFCCDQRTIYVPGWNLTAWALLYLPDANNNNEVRLAVSPTSGLAPNTWKYWDFTIAPLQLPQTSGVSLDYPQLAYSSNNLYLTTNVLNQDGTIYASAIFRCPLSALASPSGGPMSCTNFWGGNEDTFTPVDGATTTMYWANHLDNATLQVFSWPESVDWPGVTSQNVTHSAFPNGGYSCPSPDGTDICATDNWTVRGGWLAGGVLGFLWDAAQGRGSLGTFPYPYAHVVEIDQTSMSLIDEPIIWSSATAWAYSAVAVNGQGALGATAAYSGGGSFPGSAIMVRDDVSSGAWEPLNLQEGTNGPPANQWGDFLTVRAISGSGLTWLAGTYTLQGPCADNWGACLSVQPRFVWFGRAGNAPCLQPTTSQPPTVPPPSSHRIYLPVVINGCVP